MTNNFSTIEIPSLAELQTSFSESIRYQNNGEACQIVSGAFSTEQRIQIYRNNFVIGLSDILALTYPMVVALVGEECFSGLARQHVLTIPLQQADVTSYGQFFAETIAGIDTIHSAVPYLSDVARLEWLIDVNSRHEAQREIATMHTASAPHRYTFEQLAAVNESDQANIILCPCASMQLIQSPYAIFSIQDAIQTGSYEQLTIDEAEQGVIWTSDQGKAQIERLSTEAFALLNHISNGAGLGDIDADLLNHLPSLLSLNLFSHFTLNPN